MLKFLDYSSEKQMATEFTDQLSKNLPAKFLADRAKIVSVNAITRVLDSLYAKVAVYSKSSKPGFARRAVLANKIKWQMNEHGYTVEFVDMVVEGLLVVLAKNNKSD